MSDDHDIIEATPFQRAETESRQPLLRLNPVTVVISVVFLLLSAAAVFMFTARAVSIVVEPQPDVLEMTSGFYYELADRYLMLPGDSSFKASKAGYQDLAQTFIVSSDSNQTYTFELIELPGILTIDTIPSTIAEVYIDQQLVGTTPLRLDEIDAGLRDISLRSERYLDYDTEVDIIGRRELNELSANLSPAWAMIEIISEPDGANIIVDGVVVGLTPSNVEILQGYRDIDIKKDGFKMFETNIDVVASDDSALPRILLEKADGKVSINSRPAGANVTVNGRYRGQTPVSLTLEPNEGYAVVLSKAGYKPLERTINLRAEQDIALNESLKPILGVLRLAVEPSSSELFIDGVKQSTLNQRVSLTAKPHQIKVTAKGYADYLATVTPQPGTTQQLVIRLQTEAEAATAAIPTTLSTRVGLAFNLIIPAELTMGAGRREPGRRSNEIEKSVSLTRAFYLSTTEVTNKQYAAFDSGHDSGVTGRALLNDDDRPVVNISWNDAARFCNWLSEQEGLPNAYENSDGLMRAVTPLNNGYRLPTEAEWAWSARYAAGPTPTRFPWGDTMPPLVVNANYADESAANMVPYYIEGYTDNYRGPSPVTLYPSNEFGIHDLAGNVAEWIHDFYSVSTPKEVLTDPTGPASGDYHVIRGSSYKHGRFSELRWTYRDYGSDNRIDVGLRVARYLE
ncbi:MAG: sulfatase activating formylglycine-generating enzyme [Candidatus Azotimanducaceae bacterium]|jgi:formylglycine-generating enzyme required for sulfatase activity